MFAFETLDVVMGNAPDDIQAVIYAHLSFDHRIDVPRLVGALDRITTIIPEILCRADVRRHRFVRLPLESRNLVSESTGPLDVGPHFDPRTEPQMKIWLGHDDDQDSMIVVVSHILTDGRGFIQLLELLARTYSGKDVPPRNIRTLRPVINGFPVGPQTPDERDGRKLPVKYLPIDGEGKDRFLPVVKIPADRLARLREQSHQFQVTLNDILLAAHARVACRLLDVPAILLFCPTDLRPRAGLAELSVANMTGKYLVAITVNPDEPFSHTVNRVHEEMALQTASNRAYTNLVPLDRARKFLPRRVVDDLIRRTYVVTEPGYSNMGKLEQNRLVFDSRQPASFFMTIGYLPLNAFHLSVTGFASQLTLACPVVGNQDRADAVQGVLNSIVAECESWLSEPVRVNVKADAGNPGDSWRNQSSQGRTSTPGLRGLAGN
ncbi:MAG: hypothetical protein FWF25_01665 [Propionibacteriaceae bacterium]|nr:hypothetical protein [Propionibacteriaceae bacterium]